LALEELLEFSVFVELVSSLSVFMLERLAFGGETLIGRAAFLLGVTIRSKE